MARGRPLEVQSELLEAFRRSGLVTEYLVGVLPPGLWRKPPPSGRGRSIAAIVAHVQSVRRTFARLGGAKPGPPSLDRKTATPRQAQKALRQSTEILADLFETALAAGKPRVQGMPRRVLDMLTYVMQHDAHHRGQICVLAHDLGHKLRPEDSTRLWGWKARRRGDRFRVWRAARLSPAAAGPDPDRPRVPAPDPGVRPRSGPG